MKYLLVEFGTTELPGWVKALIDGGLEMTWEKVRGGGGWLMFIHSPLGDYLFGKDHFTIQFNEEEGYKIEILGNIYLTREPIAVLIAIELAPQIMRVRELEGSLAFFIHSLSLNFAEACSQYTSRLEELETQFNSLVKPKYRNI